MSARGDSWSDQLKAEVEAMKTTEPDIGSLTIQQIIDIGAAIPQNQRRLRELKFDLLNILLRFLDSVSSQPPPGMKASISRPADSHTFAEKCISGATATAILRGVA
ncbi:hypothetical protein DXG01_016582, partial [Tephrocybe rancida]